LALRAVNEVVRFPTITRAGPKVAMLQIHTNLASLAAQRHYGIAQDGLATNMQRLSGGLRINGARDDAAGLAISERLGAAVTGLNRAAKNTNDAISLLQTADGALGTVAGNFQRIRELAVQAANGSNNASDRASLQQEADGLVNANQDAVAGARFNHLALLDGSFSSQFQIGPNARDTLDVAIAPVFGLGSQGVGLVDVPLLEASTTGQVATALAAGDLVINGNGVGAALAGAQPGQGAASAYAAAAAINAAGITGISASAANSVSGAAGAAAALAGGSLTINGVALGAISGATAAQVAASAAQAIAAAGASGVAARAGGGALVLTSADGLDIVIGENVAGAAAALGLAPGTTRGSVTIAAAPSASATLRIGGANPAALGLAAGVMPATPSGGSISVLRAEGIEGEPRIDLGSFASATAALGYIDGKLDITNAIRAQLGATGRRLDAIYQDTLASAANLAAARARILDTDYAAETAAWTRGQILQSAASAIVAQANALPSQALQLLR
jgi:flagellin